MLEPIEETFNVGDVVYDDGGQRLEVIGFGELGRTKTKLSFIDLKEKAYPKQNHYKKSQRKELADMGYELVD